MRSGVVVSGTVLQGGQELATSIQNVLSRLLILQDFLPKSVPTGHLQDALRNKCFSGASVPNLSTRPYRACAPPALGAALLRQQANGVIAFRLRTSHGRGA